MPFQIFFIFSLQTKAKTKTKALSVRSCCVIGATSDQFSLGISVCFRCGTSWKGKRKMQDERRALKGFRQNYSEFILSFWNNWAMSAM